MSTPFAKAYLQLLLLLLPAYSAFAQAGVRIHGTISDRGSDSISISYNDNRLAYYPKEFFAVLDKKGNFSVALPLPAGVFTQAEIKHGAHVAEVLLQPGDDLELTVDADHYDSTIHYKGPGSAIQNFVALHTITKGRMNQYSLRLKAVIDKDPATFLKAIEHERKEEAAFLDMHKAGLPSSFISYWNNYFRYYNYFFMQQYPQVHEMLLLKRYTDTIPPQNYAVVKDLPLAFNDSLLQLPPYLLYLTGILEIKLKAKGYTYMGNDTAKYRRFQDSVLQLAYHTMPGRSAEYYVAQNLYGRAKNQPIERTRGQFGTFKEHWPESGYMPLLDKQVGLAERLAPGQPAPDIDITTPDGKHMKLSDLRGKVVYLGFWASWCRQCVGEMISERKTKEVLQNKPVAFVYVSLDKDTATAMQLIKRYKIEGIHTFVSGEWSAPEVQLYGVQGLPSYFLIDTEGKFAIQNPPTPMHSTELIVAISKLF